MHEQCRDGSVLRGLRLVAGDFCRTNLLDGAVRLRDDERLDWLTILNENAVPAIRQALPLVVVGDWGAEEMLAIGTPGLDVLPREHFLSELLTLPTSFFLGGVFRRCFGLTLGRYGLAPLLDDDSLLVAEPEVQPEFGGHCHLGVKHLLGGVATDKQDAVAELGRRRVSEATESECRIDCVPIRGVDDVVTLTVLDDVGNLARTGGGLVRPDHHPIFLDLEGAEAPVWAGVLVTAEQPNDDVVAEIEFADLAS